MFHKLLVLTYLYACCLSVVFSRDTIYKYDAIGIKGKSYHLKSYLGKVLLIVNVASECGFTDNHYKGLVQAKDVLGATGKFEILGFPCNQFGAQEPKSNKDILHFAKTTYNINFPLMSKVNVLDPDVPEVWQNIIKQSGQTPNWNFWKYLVDHTGEVINFWGPSSSVEEVFPALKAAVDAAVTAENEPEDEGPRMPASQGNSPPPPHETMGRERGTPNVIKPPATGGAPSMKREDL